MTCKAACQCGQLSLEMSAEPDIVLICTCKECQRRGGSAFTYAAFFRRADVTVTGTTKDWTRPTASGKTLTHHFCPDCGTTVFWSPDIRPDHHGVAVGCLLTEAPTPNAAIFVSEKHDWLEIPEGWKQFRRSFAEG